MFIMCLSNYYFKMYYNCTPRVNSFYVFSLCVAGSGPRTSHSGTAVQHEGSRCEGRRRCAWPTLAAGQAPCQALCTD